MRPTLAAPRSRWSGIVLALAIAACGTHGNAFQPPDGGRDITGGGGSTADGAGPNDAGGLFGGDAGSCPSCKPTNCQGGAKTTVSGTTYAPNGTMPLYDVAVYIPSGPLAPLTSGVSCDRCGAQNATHVIASALSDAHGSFQMDVPTAGTNVPLVVQVGKWRRMVQVPEIKPCADNVLSDSDLTRLPKNRKDGLNGQADMPHVAVTTGACDNLSCLLLEVGVDPGEFGVEGDDKAVVFFDGAFGAGTPAMGPAGMTPAGNLWGSLPMLEKFDVAIFSCQCGEPASSAPAGSFDDVTKYWNEGGRTFGTDYQYVWYAHSTDPGIASAMNIASGELDVQNGPPLVTVDQTFPKGAALAEWLQFVKGTTTKGQLPAQGIFDHLKGWDATKTLAWAESTDLSDNLTHARIVTTNFPVGVPSDQQCGKGAHLDLHITNDFSSFNPFAPPFPKSCSALAPAEYALAFLFFDLSACIQNDSQPPQPPPIQ